MERTKGNVKLVKEHTGLSSEMKIAKHAHENIDVERKLSMREKLEKWREEKGKNKPDKVNPLLSRKRPLVSHDSKQNVIKKMKVTVPNNIKSAKVINKIPKNGIVDGKKFARNNGKKDMGAKAKEASLNEKRKKGKEVVAKEKLDSSKVNDVGNEINAKTVVESVCRTLEKVVEVGVDGKDNVARSAPPKHLSDKTGEVPLAAIKEENEGETQEQVKNKIEFYGETIECSTSMPRNGIDQNEIKDSRSHDGRIATFSFYQTPKQQVASSKRDNRRKTVCLGPSNTLTHNSHRNSKLESYSRRSSASRDEQPSRQKTPVRMSVLRLSPKSAPHKRSDICFTKQRIGRNTQPDSNATAMHTTPFKHLMDSLPTNSVLKSAPRRPVSSARKPNKSNGTPTSKPKQNQASLTPFKSIFSRLPSNSALKSAPLRRSMPRCQGASASTSDLTHKTPSNKIQRRKTIQFTAGKPDETPICQPPFTPHGEWQNKELSIRERLDLWLAYKGNTIKKPFMVIRKNPGRKKKSAASPDAEEIGLNTTFTFESDNESETDDNTVKKIEQRIPQMNDIEKAVVEESLKEMQERAKNPTDLDTVQEELDLILSTSPGVVRLASFWIVRSRLAAAKDNVDRVICLLEQANAFDAQPQSIIRDEICKYLEQLKREQFQNEENSLPDMNINTIDNVDMDKVLNKTPKTPGKRVTFAESQQHVVFKSSLIKFCLLECTPFRRRLKSTLGRQVLTPVRRSGRIEKFESRLPSAVKSHVLTASSPSQFAKNIEEGEVYFLPNPNVTSKWNDAWSFKDAEEIKHDLSF